MRAFFCAAALALLSACETAPTVTAPVVTPAPAAPPTPAASASSRVGQMLAAAGRSDAPTQAQIEQALGPADISRHDGAGIALTYRLDHCALFLVFGADARNQVRLADAHASPRNAGEGAPSLDECASEAIARHP
jgi:hypothetical protein